MLGRRRRKAQAARQAAADLLCHALVEIRTMAYLRQDPGDPTADYAERIRMIADVCESLPGSLAHKGRWRTDVPPFLYLWLTASEPKRAWLRKQWTRIGYDFSELEARPGGGVWTMDDVFPERRHRPDASAQISQRRTR
ncbi:hypothetical protein [Catellatospora sp. NPDC049609]|uniref:hypothetical protein n=1 Tax=Catellatospora sp. NPDC049609 TaxID=3155505 RepID=UPI003439E7F6